jgi:hypothetical protein
MGSCFELLDDTLIEIRDKNLGQGDFRSRLTAVLVSYYQSSEGVFRITKLGLRFHLGS